MKRGVHKVKHQASIKRLFLSKPYPENLILTIMQGEMESYDVTEDIQAGVDYALAELTDVEREVLKLRFQNQMTYSEIGEVRGRTRNAACGTENNALRKLRHSSRCGYVLYGKKGFEAMGCKLRYPWEEVPREPEKPDLQVLLTPLETMNFSVRSFNTLRRAGYVLVKDIIDLSYEQILHIKNLPRKNCMEIAAELRKLGISNTAWRDFLH